MPEPWTEPPGRHDLPSGTPATLYTTFWLGESRFGVPVLQVREVHAPTTITPIPHAPSAIRGYVNLRGQLHVVLDPRPWLLRSENSPAHEGYLIVFKPHVAEACAIQVDRLGDILPIHDSQRNILRRATDQPQESPTAHQILTGHAKLDDSIVTLVDAVELYRVCWINVAPETSDCITPVFQPREYTHAQSQLELED